MSILDGTRGYERLDPSWHTHVDEVQTVEEVVRLAREFVATLTPEQLARLPERCRPLRVKAEDDIEYWAYKLSGVALEERHDPELLQDLCMHFLHASMRIAQIHRARARYFAEGSAFSDGV